MTTYFKILGRTQVRLDGAFIDDWGALKERGVLAVLLLNLGRVVPARILAEWVWPVDKAPRDPAATLSTYSTRIRNALKRLSLPGELKAEDGGYRFLADPATVDYHAFQQSVRDARRLGRAGEHERACGIMEAALRLWEERPLADLDTDRAENWRRVAIRDEWLSANDGLLYGLYKRGEFDEMLRVAKSAQFEHDGDVLLAKRRLQALYSLRRSEEGVQYFYDFYRRAKAEDRPEQADELRRFHDGLAHADAAPPSGIPADGVLSPRNLPYDVDGFTGHRDLLTRLDCLVPTPPKPRLVALDGPPGVGKTALAVHWAHRVADRFPHGVWFVNLNGYGDGAVVTDEEVVSRLLEALGVSADCLPTADARRRKLADVLSGRRLLLVLDNAVDGRHVHDLLPLLSGSFVVVTSRMRLSDLSVRHGAHCLTVTPLQPGLAVTWLCDRLGSRADVEPGAVAELASLACGLPLALGIIGEYVAAQPGKSLREFVARLRERGAVLGLGSNGTQAIQSLRAVFDCSYRALRPEVRRLFRLLGIYPGLAFQHGVAAALTGLRDVEVHDLLEALVWARLLEAREGDRYAFHDLVRTYAAERVEDDEDPDERARAARRMVDWFLHSCNNVDRLVFTSRLSVPMSELSAGVTPLTFADAESAVDWSVRERGELVAVVDFAGANGFDEHLWRLINCIGEVMMRLGFKDEVLRNTGVAVRAARSVGDRFAEAGSLCNLGLAHARFYDYDEAERCYRAAHGIFVELDHRIGLATVLRNMGERRGAIGDTPGALDYLELALDIAREEGDPDAEAGILQRMGEALRLGDRLGEAIAKFHLGWMLRERIGDIGGIGVSLASLAATHHQQGDHFGALSFAHQAMVMLRQARDFALEGQASTTLAAVHRDLDDLEKAEFHATRAITLTRQAQDPKRQAGAQDVLGQVLWRQGRHREARECWSLALGLYAGLGDSRADGIRAQLAEWAEPDVPPGRSASEVSDGSSVGGS
ncbi:tetratricopeptide repeat protein [Actinosynnema sp. NPDC050436]|uniref:tetratricopeptide repeat protein n=1 Tax=Actinosynnema sp. NPDC050436 TaxID=3155659 RepID=UPI0033F95C79